MSLGKLVVKSKKKERAKLVGIFESNGLSDKAQKFILAMIDSWKDFQRDLKSNADDSFQKTVIANINNFDKQGDLGEALFGTVIAFMERISISNVKIQEKFIKEMRIMDLFNPEKEVV